MTRAFDWLTREHWLIGASLMRISLGIWAVFFLALHWRVRGQLWGPDGLLPFERFMESGPVLNVFSISRSAIYFEVIYLLAVAIAVLVVIGYRPRLILPMHWLMIWSFQDRNQQLGDGGDNLMRLVLLFLLLVNTGAHFSLAAARRPRQRWPGVPMFRLGESLIRLMRPGLTVVHNFGVLLILIQLGMLYLSTGLYKAMGELWQNGTALYYILRVDEFSWPGVAELIYRNPYLVVLGTYGTVLFEVLFLPSLFNRWTRYVMIAAGVCFHTGIALLMGLVTFGWSMLSVYPLLVTDLEYRQIVAWARRRLDLVVFYDGWCPMCTRSVRVLRNLDLLSVVEYISFRDPGVVHYYGLDSERAARRIQALDRRGRVREGIDALIAVAARSPLMWPIVPMLVVGRGVAGQRFYDAAAARRVILVPGSCQSDCAVSE
ncbi:MAG: DCC1-like thiol-disulfide oxidoreductase family protein [Armatimonadota bacterium]